MNERDEPATPENPFSSRRVRPGALPFLFAPGETAWALVDRLRRNAWRGQVIGPHGSGKSALLAALAPAIERAGRRVLPVELHDGQRRLPLDLRRTARLDTSTVVIIDGYEQLGRWVRFRLRRFCRRRRVGLVVTAHVPVGLPELYRTTANLPLARQIVQQLQRDYPSYITREDVAERFSRHRSDLREMLFDLYDLYEQRRLA